MRILPKISCHEDLLCLSDGDRNQLCAEIRESLVSSVSKTGGHLAGNLGIVELAVAIETVYNTQKDRLVFDVGHQSYVHKMLTGRQKEFDQLRQYGGISGFPKPSESETDAFVAGHASSSVSIALGMARARTMLGEEYDVVALIGDGAVTGGMAYEGLNNAAVSREPMVIILNDNEMSIGKNVGGMSAHLSRVRSSENYLGAKQVYRKMLKKLPGGKVLYNFSSRMKNRVKRFLLPASIFESMGFTYLGPADGHDIAGLITLLTAAKELHEPVVIHVVTKKGYGYKFAEEDPAKFHGIGKFDPETGKKLGSKVKTFSDSFGDAIVEMAKTNPRICAITAAMPGGTGLLNLMKQYPERLFDVGIAEEHAISMAGGLAKQGMIPVVALYSTFLQRGYDQIMQDVCMLNLHVVFAIDRAGLVGDDGPTHHGVFDIGMLRQMPGLLVLNPVSLAEQRDMLHWAVEKHNGPVAIRYPRGTEGGYTASDWKDLNSSVVVHRSGDDIAFITYGSMLDNTLAAAEILAQQGIEAAVIRLMNLSDLHVEQILEKTRAKKLIVVEEACTGSGIREALAYDLMQLESMCRIYGRDLGPDFVTHGDKKRLYENCGLDADSLAAFAKEVR